MKPDPVRHVHGKRSSRQLEKMTWPDFEKLFAANGGVWGGCWCMYFHKPGSFDPKAYSANRASKRSLVDAGRAHGTLVYCGDDPVGWCQFGPKEELTRIDHKKGYTPALPDSWRVTCIFIAPGHRRQGLAEYAVAESLKAMKKLGAPRAEAYPVEGKLTASLLWSGTPALFEGSGFRRASRLGKNSWVYTKDLTHR